MRKAQRPSTFSSERKCEILGVGVLGCTALLFLILVTDGFDGRITPNRTLESLLEVDNLLGWPGAAVAGLLALAIGDAAHILYTVTLIWGVMLLTHRPIDRILTRLLGLLLLTGAVAGLLQIDLIRGAANPPQPGGAFGVFVADRFIALGIGHIGANIVCLTFAFMGILLATDFLFVHGLQFLHHGTIHMIRGNLAMFDGAVMLWRKITTRRIPKAGEVADVDADTPVPELVPDEPRPPAVVKIHARDVTPEPEPEPEAKPEPLDLPFDAVPEISDAPEAVVEIGAEELAAEALPEIVPESSEPEDMLEPITGSGMPIDAPVEPEEAPKPTPVTAQMDLVRHGGMSSEPKRRIRRKNIADALEELPADYEYPRYYSRPSIDLFDEPEERVIENLEERLRATGSLLEETLQTFSIEARVTDVTRGPTITRFELEPAAGIKVSRFLALSDDIALALKAHRVRVEAPIPGKGRVGIEVPNKERDQVLIRELLESKRFRRGKGKLKLALGKDIEGNVNIADLTTMPHCLVAGATGSGKTVCVKSLMASLLFQHTPEELQLMLIDPKMVELSVFNDIPHLITPVVTDPKKAATALSWLINEMEERYRLFADLRVRNIEVYNKSVENGEIEVEGEDEDEDEHQSYDVIRKLPYIVCIIDELADLMMLARAEVEDAIARLAQLARAVGIHLIIATQRPSVDVLTGVIKANFPARVSFQVSSRVDSRCILDEIGAEKLIGWGDMLYLPAGQSKPHRMQGAFVSDEEMFALVAYLKSQAPPQYRDEIQKFGQNKDSVEDLEDANDPLFDEGVQVVLDTGQASISMVQRRLRVGYTRAARLIDMMEMRGIVGPHTGSKAREILVDGSAKDEVA